MCSITSEAMTLSKLASGNGRRRASAPRPRRDRGLELAAVGLGAEQVGDLAQLGEVEVDGGDGGAEAGGLEGVAPRRRSRGRSTGQPARQPERVVADGQHGVAAAPQPCVRGWRVSPGVPAWRR
jgi:hypothetical protein